MREVDKKLILELSSRNIQRSLKEYGIGPHTAAGMLYQLIEAAQKMIDKGGSEYPKGVNLLKFCYEKLESFVKHVEGSKVDISDKSKFDEMSGQELDKILLDIAQGKDVLGVD